jgi:hypothetical protein
MYSDRRTSRQGTLPASTIRIDEALRTLANVNQLLSDARQHATFGIGESMSAKTQEELAQAAARRRGLKLVWDRHSSKAIGRNQHILRPIWDASRAVRVLPDGSFTLVVITVGRRNAASMLSLDAAERLLSLWNERKPFAPARLPWQAGVVAQSTRW